MYCKKCGAKIDTDATFCEECGAKISRQQDIDQGNNQILNDGIMSYSSNESIIDIDTASQVNRWPMFLILSGIGIVGMLIIRVFMAVFSKKLFGEFSSGAIGSTCTVFIVWSFVILVIEAILLFSKKPIKKTLTSALPIALEAVFIVLLLVLAPVIARLFSPYDVESLSMVASLLRRTAIFAIIPMICSGILTFVIGKQSSVWNIVIICSAVVLAFGSALLISHDIYLGKRLFAEFGYAIGLIQPFAALMPLTVKNRSGVHKKQIKSTQTNQANTVSNNVIMFCPNCGTRFPYGKKFCDQCGSELKETVGQVNSGYQNANDAPSTGFSILGFFFPVVGLILYLVWKDTLPLRAKSTGKGALIGAITSVALTIVSYIIYFVILSSLF